MTDETDRPMTGPGARSRPPHGKPRRGERGFSLVEILVVLAILALLAALVGPRLIGYLGGAKSETAALQIDNISAALQLYYLDNGTYPTTDQGLEALIEAPSGLPQWDGPYLQQADGIRDPWGRVYRYRYPGEHGDFDIYTYGRDDSPGGEDEDADVTSWSSGDPAS